MTQTQHVQPVLAGALLLPLPRCILSDFSQRNATILHLHAFTQTTQGLQVWSGICFSYRRLCYDRAKIYCLKLSGRLSDSGYLFKQCAWQSRLQFLERSVPTVCAHHVSPHLQEHYKRCFYQHKRIYPLLIIRFRFFFFKLSGQP